MGLMSAFKNMSLAQNHGSASGMYHGMMLDLANMSYMANVRDSAIGFGAIGGLYGAFSSDSSVLGAAAEGALVGIGKGVATKIAANHYAHGAFKSGTAMQVTENGIERYGMNLAKMDSFSMSNFKHGWENRNDIFGNSAFKTK